MEDSTVSRRMLCCSICLDPLKEPVTIPCGHNYCKECINKHWDEENSKNLYSCPQCRQTFSPRPNLVKNTMLAELVEKMKKPKLQAAVPDHCYAGDGDVACDFCDGRKLKAIKSCLQCLVSFCEQHLKPHYNTPALKKHQLIKPSKSIQENICPHHGEAMRLFCRTDQQSICYQCSFDEHRAHDTVSAAAERGEKQKLLEPTHQKVKQKIQDKQKYTNVLLQEMKVIEISADKAVEDIEKIFTDLIHLIQNKSSEIKQQIRNKQKTEVGRVKEFLQQLKQEITEMQSDEAELQQLFQTEIDTQFLHMFPFYSEPSQSAEVFLPKPCTQQYFQEVTKSVSGVKDLLQRVLRTECLKVLNTLTNMDVLLHQAEPRTRDDFLQYAQRITLNPNTVNKKLILSEGDREVTYSSKKQTYPPHPERFMNRSQVLSREALTGRHYWEVEWSEFGAYIGVANKNISRVGDDSEFGDNDQSWVLLCSSGTYEFFHDSCCTSLSGPFSTRVGVYLDHKAGILSFYSVSNTMTLLHKVHTKFTQPLHACFRAYYILRFGSTVVFCDLQ